MIFPFLQILPACVKSFISNRYVLSGKSILPVNFKRIFTQQVKRIFIEFTLKKLPWVKTMLTEENKTQKFWLVFGDIHNDIQNLSRISDIGEAQGIIISGDLTNYGTGADAEKILREIEKSGKLLYAQIGNMDLMEVNDLLDKKNINIHARVSELTPDIAIFGIGGSTPTPMNTPTEFPEEKYAEWLSKEWAQAKKYKHAILISHNPPKDTCCDDLGAGIHVGSTAVREFIEKCQPDLCICGHIHEASEKDQIGKTMILNPGPFSEGGYVKIGYENNILTANMEKVNL